jgi:hypothetical protein
MDVVCYNHMWSVVAEEDMWDEVEDGLQLGNIPGMKRGGGRLSTVFLGTTGAWGFGMEPVVRFAKPRNGEMERPKNMQREPGWRLKGKVKPQRERQAS